MRRVMRAAMVLLVVSVILAPTAASASPGSVIDFEGLTPGQVITEVSFGFGISGDPVPGVVTVHGTNFQDASGANAAIVFDATCAGDIALCTGGDDDLYFPEHGNIAIVAASLRDRDRDGLVDDPNDAENGGFIEYDFSDIGTVFVDRLVHMDTEEGGEVEVFVGGPTGTLLATIPMQETLDNVKDTLEIGVGGVDFMRVTRFGSGGVDQIEFVAEVDETATVGDFVWFDTDGDGVQDADELGVEGFTVTLQDCDGNVVATTTTDADGFYLFEGLDPGCYQLEFTAPDGLVFTLQDQGGDDALDSDVDPATGLTAQFDLVAGDNSLIWDAGLVEEPVEPASIGDLVWLDTDGDGIQDAGEPGVEGVTVELLDSGGVVVATTTTDVSGLYSFDGLAPGDYSIRVVLPVGFAFTAQDQGGDDTIDSDADPVTGETVQTTLEAGESDFTWDAGLLALVPAIQIVKEADVEVLAGTDVTFTITVTNIGDMDLTNVVVSDPLAPDCDLVIGDLAVGESVSYECTVAAVTASFTNVATVTGDAPDETQVTDEDDAVVTVVQLGSIGDLVWQDLDGDGIQDPGEPGLEGVTVTLFDCEGNVVATTTTDASGLYEFTGLAPGCYQVGFSLPAGFGFAPADQGGDDLLDSDADAVTGLTGQITLAEGAADTSVDAGLVALVPSATLTKTIDLASVVLVSNGDGTNTLTMSGQFIIDNTGDVDLTVTAVADVVSFTTADTSGTVNPTSLTTTLTAGTVIPVGATAAFDYTLSVVIPVGTTGVVNTVTVSFAEIDDLTDDASFPLQVLANGDDDVDDEDTLPDTGIESRTLLVLALVMLATGGVMVLATRREETPAV